MAVSPKTHALLQLIRFDKPIGTLLLLWPALWALWLAAQGVPDYTLLAIFLAGTFLARSAGCIINDLADRNLDGAVARTNARPLVTGAITVREAVALFVVLMFARVHTGAVHQPIDCHTLYWCGDTRLQLPVYETLHAITTTGIGRRIFLEYSDGLRCPEWCPASRAMAGLSGKSALDHGLRHGLRHGRPGGRPQNRHKVCSHIIWPVRPPHDCAAAGIKPDMSLPRGPGIRTGPLLQRIAGRICRAVWLSPIPDPRTQAG